MPTTRQTPLGTKLEDGFSTKITHASDPDIAFWEKTVTPPGIDGGDAIEQTTMHNTAWRTFAPRSLKTLTESSCKCAYDPRVWDSIVALINVPGLITVEFSDGSELDFYGYFKSFVHDELSEGTQPEATLTFVPTNVNPATGAEVAPNYITPAGTA